ncbi:MAG: hypothetical protein ACRD1U_13205 [Vicinamibacterales bacterium]
MTAEPPDPGRETPLGDDDLGPPIAELEGLSLPVGSQFGDRVRSRIERRLLAGHFLELAWAAPFTMLLEFLRVPFDLLSGRRPR